MRAADQGGGAAAAEHAAEHVGDAGEDGGGAQDRAGQAVAAGAGRFADDGQTRHSCGVAGVPAAHLVEKPPVDFEDDLEVPWQHTGEERHRPLLQCLGQQRVVRVRQRALRHGPRRVPVHDLFVDQQAHQLRDGDRGMGIVQLRHEPAIQRRQRATRLEVHADHVLERTGDEEILLLEPEPLPLAGLVIRIQDLRQVFGDALSARPRGSSHRR